MAFTERYVTTTGAGLHDGTDEANAFTWAEMITDAATPRTGYRYNVKAGAYTSSTNETFQAGSAAAPNAIRGYNSTIGDQDALRDDCAAAAHDTTNWPVMTYSGSGRLTLGANTILQNVKLVAAVAGVTLTTGTSAQVVHCVLENTHATSGSSRAIQSGATYPYIVDCDLITASNNSAARTLDMDRGTAHNCRISSGGGYGALTGLVSTLYRCAFVSGEGGVITNSTHAVVSQCSFRGLTGDIFNHPASGILVIKNCVAWGGTGSRWYNSPTSVRSQIQVNNCFGNMSNADVNEGDYPVISEVALSADPFTSSTDLTLNSTAGGGAACKDVGLGANLDAGVKQSAAVGGAGGVMTHPGMVGGVRG